jgi:uncharacterized protein with PIN domain
LSEDREERFIADVMLGRLARWLRALGYDTEYDSNLDDPCLAERAIGENRVLLTRDVELSRRRGLTFVLIDNDDVANQLRQVVSTLRLTLDGAFPRCPVCNGELMPTPRAELDEEVPPYVLATQTHFRRCSYCGKVYWHGTHWERMSGVLKEIGESA